MRWPGTCDFGGSPNCVYDKTSDNCTCNFLYPCQEDVSYRDSYRLLYLNYNVDLELDSGIVTLSKLTYNGTTQYKGYSIIPTGLQMVYKTGCNTDTSG